MNTYEIMGLFSDTVYIYHYPSLTPSNKVLLVLKGIYGEHLPFGNSWDNSLVSTLQNNYHLVFVRTSRISGQIDKEAFLGKTFEQERLEILNAFEYCQKNTFSKDALWGAVGVSLGGTLLLSCPQILSLMKLTIMVGSGCGKNPETTKPLLSTLPETENLLCSLDTYKNTFVFMRGEDDPMVPLSSQRMIYERIEKNAQKCRWVSLPNLDHSLRDVSTRESHMAEILIKYIQEIF